MENIVLDKIEFKNGIAGGTPINKDNLKAMQTNTQNALNTLKTAVENELSPITEDITDLQGNTTNNSTLAEQNRRFIESMLKDMEKEGTSIHVEDSADFGCKLVPYGKSVQKTRSGKNEFDLSKVNTGGRVSKTETGVILDRCWATSPYSPENTSKMLKANTTYTMCAKAKVLERPTTMTASNDNLFMLYKASNPYVWMPCLTMSDKHSIPIGEERTYVTSFTTPENITGVSIVSYTFHGNNTGATTGEATGKIEISDIMLVEGSYTEENFPAYEEYGVMPSPDYPSKIENVEGDLVLKFVGKNYFNINDLNVLSSNVANKVINDNSITLTSVERATTSYLKFNVDYPINKPLTISFDATILEGDGLNVNPRVFFRRGMENTVYGSKYLLGGTEKKSYTVTIPDGIPEKDYMFWLYIKANAKAGTIKIKFDNIQIEEGETATSYEPYKKPQKVTFPLSEGQKLMEGSYLADDGIHHTRRHFELAIANMNNSEEYPGWANLPNLHDDFPEKNAKFNNVTDYYSNIYKSQEQKININTVATRSSLFFNPDCGLTQTQWKEQYPDLVFKIEYGLPKGKEWTEPYTEVQAAAKKEIDALKTNQTVTNITNNQDTKMKLTYKKDIQKQIEETEDIKARLAVLEALHTTTNEGAE